MPEADSMQPVADRPATGHPRRLDPLAELLGRMLARRWLEQQGRRGVIPDSAVDATQSPGTGPRSQRAPDPTAESA